MKLSMSNIGWSSEQDSKVYRMLVNYGFSGIEIAPTRIFPQDPYDKNTEAVIWRKTIKDVYDLEVSSMQSIWYGRQERLFGGETERKTLISYTKRAIIFAETMGCRNIVFGCPRNRNLLEKARQEEAIPFFRELGDFAVQHGVTIGMEANPAIYGTNYINTTEEALQLIDEVDSPGFLLNLDMGTMIQNNENLDILKDNVHLISHVHISEPGLAPIKKRKIHEQIKEILINGKYERYISIEMAKVEADSIIEDTLKYVGSVME